MSDIKIDSPLVSIIMPCYNGGKYLSETLESVYKQTYENWECIIMDDGSTDNSKQVISEYQKKDKRYKYFYQSNKGTSAARNNAIHESKGKYILPLDSDDKISPQYIEQAADVLEKSNDVKLVYAKAMLFGILKGPWNLRPYSQKEMLIENMIFCSALFRRTDFDNTPGFSEDMRDGFEDWDFWLTFLNESDKVHQIPEVHFYYRIRDNSRNPSVDEAMQKELRRQIYVKYKALYDKYFKISDVLFEYSKIRNQYTILQKSNSDALQSTTFKIGRMIVKPLQAIQNIFK
jgi:glycosyltransferase involved in cell wall biosynthesis